MIEKLEYSSTSNGKVATNLSWWKQCKNCCSSCRSWLWKVLKYKLGKNPRDILIDIPLKASGVGLFSSRWPWLTITAAITTIVSSSIDSLSAIYEKMREKGQSKAAVVAWLISTIVSGAFICSFSICYGKNYWYLAIVSACIALLSRKFIICGIKGQVRDNNRVEVSVSLDSEDEEESINHQELMSIMNTMDTLAGQLQKLAEQDELTEIKKDFEKVRNKLKNIIEKPHRKNSAESLVGKCHGLTTAQIQQYLGKLQHENGSCESKEDSTVNIGKRETIIISDDASEEKTYDLDSGSPHL